MARLVGAPRKTVAFRSRASLRDDMPPMSQPAGEAIQKLREAERF